MVGVNMWEALDKWPRQAVLGSLIELVGLDWRAQEGKESCHWESETISNQYWTTYRDIKIYLFVPTDKMTHGTKRPFLKLASKDNIQVIITQKDEEKELFDKLIAVVNNIATWIGPVLVMQGITV